MTILKYELRGFDGIVLDEDLWIELENEDVSIHVGQCDLG